MKVYTMVNKDNGARIRCTEKFIVKWLAKGFEVESFELDGKLLEEEEE